MPALHLGITSVSLLSYPHVYLSLGYHFCFFAVIPTCLPLTWVSFLFPSYHTRMPTSRLGIISVFWLSYPRACPTLGYHFCFLAVIPTCLPYSWVSLLFLSCHTHMPALRRGINKIFHPIYPQAPPSMPYFMIAPPSILYFMISIENNIFHPKYILH